MPNPPDEKLKFIYFVFFMVAGFIVNLFRYTPGLFPHNVTIEVLKRLHVHKKEIINWQLNKSISIPFQPKLIH